MSSILGSGTSCQILLKNHRMGRSNFNNQHF
uniref:Uncharacterized protein n=1 Tax=Arundo donax TaxID=35708 RepID=A0A0A9F3I3_ARUDO